MMLRRTYGQRVERVNRHRLPQRTQSSRRGVPMFTMALLFVTFLFFSVFGDDLRGKELDQRVRFIVDRALQYGIGEELRDEAYILSGEIRTSDEFLGDMVMLMADGKLPTREQKKELRKYRGSQKLIDAMEKFANK